MVKQILFQSNFKKHMRSFFGQSFYTKIALLPQSDVVKQSLKTLYDLGYDTPYSSWPTVVAIEINAHCNRKCVYCPNHNYDRTGGQQGFLDESLFQAIIDDLAMHGYYRSIYYHIYNEPLLDERLPEFIAYTRERLPEATIDIYTNGDFLDIGVYHTLIQRGADRFVISLHGEKPSPNLRDTLRHLPPKEKTATLMIMDTFRDYKAKKNGFFNRGGAIITHRKQRRSQFCPFVLDCNINFKGDVILCCNDFFGDYIFGNVKNRPLSEIWFDKEYINLRNRVTFGDREFKLCKRCNV
ncbi:MAG: SPASM domain-containing protein [Candidatus Aminicenantes bacterium]|jgi:radical SAM protein with 4Fe4S-binding SPASM domain